MRSIRAQFYLFLYGKVALLMNMKSLCRSIQVSTKNVYKPIQVNFFLGFIVYWMQRVNIRTFSSSNPIPPSTTNEANQTPTKVTLNTSFHSHHQNPILTDKFSRMHNYLRISLVERCNILFPSPSHLIRQFTMPILHA